MLERVWSDTKFFLDPGSLGRPTILCGVDFGAAAPIFVCIGGASGCFKV